MKKLYLAGCLLLASVVLHAQETQLFSDSFTDNHNNWPLSKKKPKAAFEGGGYLIDNLTYEHFAVLQTIPFNAAKDFRISITVHSEYMDPYEYSLSKTMTADGDGGMMFGAKDEKNGYCVVMSSRYEMHSLSVFKLVDGKKISLFDKWPKFSSEKISVVSENNRWKILDGTNEIASIAAEPFMGDKAGIFVSKRQKWTIKSFSVFAKEKGAAIKKTEFPAALFIVTFQEALCKAKTLFLDERGTAIGAPKDSIWRCSRSIAGLDGRSELYMPHKTVDFSVNKYFETKVEAMNYYDDLKKAIEMTPDSCWTLKESDNSMKREAMNDMEQWDNWQNQFQLKTERVGYVDANVAIVSGKSPRGNGYLVELHIVLKW